MPSVPITAVGRPSAGQALRDPVRAGSLAVGAGDPGHPHLARRLRRRRAPPWHRGARANPPTPDSARASADPSRIPCGSHSTRAAPAAIACGMYGAPVAALARQRNKRIACAAPCGCRCKPGDRHAQRGEHGGIEVTRPRSYLFPHFGQASNGFSGASGASGGTARMRSASAITALNTGAATTPP